MKKYHPKNRILNYIFGFTWLFFGIIYFIDKYDRESIGISILAFVIFFITPSILVPTIALRNKLILDKRTNILIIRSLFHTHVISIDNIIDIKFPKYRATHIKNKLKKAFYSSDDSPFITCFVICKNDEDGILIPFKTYKEKEFRLILTYLKSVNKNLNHVEYPPNVLF